MALYAEGFPVGGEEFGFWRLGIIWEAKGDSSEISEIGFYRWGRNLLFQTWRKDEPEALIEGDEAGIKGGIVEPGKGQAIANVEPFIRVGAPWQDV